MAATENYYKCEQHSMQIQALVMIKIDTLKGCKMNIDFLKNIQKCHQEGGRNSKGYPENLLLPPELILLPYISRWYILFLNISCTEIQ